MRLRAEPSLEVEASVSIYLLPLIYGFFWSLFFFSVFDLFFLLLTTCENGATQRSLCRLYCLSLSLFLHHSYTNVLTDFKLKFNNVFIIIYYYLKRTSI